ncbi:uncharacterized protein LOC144469479 [Augochlora pura]
MNSENDRSKDTAESKRKINGVRRHGGNRKLPNAFSFYATITWKDRRAMSVLLKDTQGVGNSRREVRRPNDSIQQLSRYTATRTTKTLSVPWIHTRHRVTSLVVNPIIDCNE